MTPIEETVMRSLDDLVPRQGKVLYLGISDAPAWVVSDALRLARERGLAPFSAHPDRVQPRRADARAGPAPDGGGERALGARLVAAGSGALTGKYLDASGDASGSGRLGRRLGRLGGAPRQRHVGGRRRQVPVRARERAQLPARRSPSRRSSGGARRRSRSRGSRAQPGRHIPILGARKLAHLEDNLGALDVELSAEHLDRLGRASRVPLGFPHDFLASDGMSPQFVFGQTYA